MILCPDKLQPQAGETVSQKINSEVKAARIIVLILILILLLVLFIILVLLLILLPAACRFTETLHANPLQSPFYRLLCKAVCMNRDTLRLLGAGQSIDSICKTAGCTRAEFDAWWKQEAASRAPRCTGEIAAPLKVGASIERDRWGIPHIFAENQHDLFFAYGLAMAQDRLFQLDYLRRKGLGRVA